MNKPQVIKLLKDEGWTEADAKRALEVIDFNTNPDELTIRRTISSFAGSELINRQRSQAAQKRLVTMKKKEIEQKDKEYAIKLNRYEYSLKQEKKKYEIEIKSLVSRNAHLENIVKSLESEDNEVIMLKEQLKKENNELVRVNEQLKIENKDLKNIVDAIKLRLAIDVKNLLRYEDSEIRKALVKLFKSTLG